MKSDSEEEEEGDEEEREKRVEEKMGDEETPAALPEFRVPEATGYCVFVEYFPDVNCMRGMLLLA